jgi:catechol 2,3-dioxygenase-like lactoylglutathione lyase family enzyme
MQTTAAPQENRAPAMRVDGADHINIVIRDVEASVAFYAGVLGLEQVAPADYRPGMRGIISFRVSNSFLIHMLHDPDAPRAVARRDGFDHLCLTVTGVTPDELVAYLAERGVAIEGGIVTRWDARGDGPAVYVTDPDGYRIELKVYP